MDINLLKKQLSKKIKESESKNLKKMYTILIGQLMIIEDILLYKEEELNRQIYLISILKDTLDNIKKILKKFY